MPDPPPRGTDSIIAPRFQFDFRSLALTAATLGLYLAYVRTFGFEWLATGLLALVVPAIAGVLVGLWNRRLHDVVFWALAGGISGHVATLGEVSLDPNFRHVLPWAGGAAAMAVAASPRRNLWRGLANGAATGGLLTAILMWNRTDDWPSRLYLAFYGGVFGMVLGLLVELRAWSQVRWPGKVSPAVWFAGLVAAMIAVHAVLRVAIRRW